MGERINGARSAALMALVAPIRGLKEPFKASDVERCCKVDPKKAQNVITRLKIKGWIELAGEAAGSYKRTASFGGIQLADIHAEIDSTKPRSNYD